MYDDFRRQTLSGKMIDEIAAKINWKDFENLVSEIFESNLFFTRKNFRFKTRNRYEVDLIAVKDHLIFCVDCKQWKKGRTKKSGLRKAATNQEKRTNELRKFLRKNVVAKKMMKIKNQTWIPLIVSLHDEDILWEGQTLFVPLWKLNSFLIEPEKFI